MIREVKTENGRIRGIEAADPRITAFKGIPFAAPPVGKNRWRAPQPCENWEGIRDASRFAPISVQDVPGLGDTIYNREWNVDPEIPMDEDCLYLNVWTGAKSADEKLPVLVWFYGGALQWGNPAEMEFDGERLARRGVVVVSVNYRINVFGFLAHPQITLEQPEAPANFGSLDQQAGIRWVIRNIAAFGGDPDNITIAGQSAGGGSVLSQMACPDNAGLFQRAVIMSAMIRSPYEEGGIGIPQSLCKAEESGQNFFDFLGVANLEEARALDAFYIRDKYAEYAQIFPRMFTVVDGRFCVGDPLTMFLEGKCAPVSVMAGNTADEFPSFLVAKDDQELEKKAKKLFGDKAETFLAFPETRDMSEEGKYAKVNGLECSAKALFSYSRKENDITDNGRNYYYYRFTPDIPGEDNPGTFHSCDLWFFFETLAKCWRPFVGHHYDLARKMCNYWANFIKTGDPNGQDADGSPMPEWKPYTKEEPCEMIFTADVPVVSYKKETPFKAFLIDKVKERLEKGERWCEEWMKPLWETDTVYRETFAMIEEDGMVKAPFLFPPERILCVESYDGETAYKQERDYKVEDGNLVLTKDSSIPHTGWGTFFYDTEEEARQALEKSHFGLDFGPVAAANGKFINLEPIGHPELVTKWQTAVTYTTTGKRFHAVQKSNMESLPRLQEKVAKKEPVKIVLFGDSICCGFDCSGKYGQQPGQPVWAKLLLHRIEEKWDSSVSFHNTSLSGMDTEWAIENAYNRAGRYQPDLVILGFGMNDRCGMEEYREKTQRLIDAIKKDSPQTEVLLVSTTLPNPLCGTPPMYFMAHQEEYAEALRGLCREGVGLADVQEVHREINTRKRYIDLTGNWLNHPNDFLARLYAQTVAAALAL